MDRLTEKQALIAFGANLPADGRSPEITVRAAAERISQAGLIVNRLSRLFQTPCFPAGAGPDYVNAAALVDLAALHDPTSTLGVLHEIEAEFGRERQQRWGMRTLDLDLLAVGDSVLPDQESWQEWAGLPPARQIVAAPDRLILPHPRLQDRAFVLVPLLDVLPEWRHPVLRLTVREMLAALPAEDRDAVRPLTA